MSYEAVDKVIRSGVEDATLFSVLLALAFFKNDRTGECFPSTAKIASAARRSQNIVRSAIKRLEELGYVEANQAPGLRRFFVIHLDRLPTKRDPLEEAEPLSEVKPLTEVKPLSDPQGAPFQKCEGTPVRSERGPLSEVKAEQGIKQGIEQGIEQGMSASAPTAPKLKRRSPSKPCPWEPGTPIPEELEAYAKEQFPTVDCYVEFQKFINYCLSHDKRFARWDAAFRNWLANALKFQQQRGGNGGSNYRPRRQPTCPGDWEKEFKGVDYTRGAVMKEFTPEESARLATLAEEMNF